MGKGEEVEELSTLWVLGEVDNEDDNVDDDISFLEVERRDFGDFKGAVDCDREGYSSGFENICSDVLTSLGTHRTPNSKYHSISGEFTARASLISPSRPKGIFVNLAYPSGELSRRQFIPPSLSLQR